MTTIDDINKAVGSLVALGITVGVASAIVKKVNKLGGSKNRVSRKPKSKLKFTSITSSHRHKWLRTRRFTTVNNGHSHRISTGRKLALANKKGGHTHRLLSRAG